MADDRRASKFFEDRIQSIAKKGRRDRRVADIAASICVKRVDADDVGPVLLNEPPQLADEIFAGERFLLDVDDALVHELALFVGEIQMIADAARHLGEVAVIVLGLNRENARRARRPDAERGFPERPQNVLLDGRARFADSRWPDK